MKVSDYAKHMGVSYRTAWSWWKAGQLRGQQLPGGTIIVDDPFIRIAPQTKRAAIYARVSAPENRPNLESQAEHIVAYCLAKGYQVQ